MFIKYKGLIRELVSRDLKLKYRRSFLGYLWSILNPLLSLLIMRCVFGHFFGSAIPHYTVYLLCGTVLFNKETLYTCFLALSLAFRTASVTSFAFPMP